MRHRGLGWLTAVAGITAIVSASLPWWRFPTERIFGLGIPSHSIGGLERWHGWAAGALGIVVLAVGAALAWRPSSARGLGLTAGVLGLLILAVVALALLGEGRAVRPGAGSMLAGLAGIIAASAGFGAARRREQIVQRWTHGRPGSG